MIAISPRLLGFVVVLGGVCAALLFQKPTSREVAVAPVRNSETIEWRSKDFTLEVTAHDPPLTGPRSAAERPHSPAFGGVDAGAIVNSRASLDHVTQPPALAGDYSSATTVAPRDANGLGENDTPPAAPRPPADDAPAAGKPPRSIAITHTITDGDSLAALAEKHLGSRLRWTEIYNANPEILDDPEVLPVGATIVILPGIQPSRPASSDETDSLVPVSSSDLLRFRDAGY